MLPFITTYKSVQVSRITFLKRLSGDTKSNSTWRIYISVTSDVNSSRTLVNDPKFLVFLIFWMCQHKMWCLFDMSASCDIVNEAPRESKNSDGFDCPCCKPPPHPYTSSPQAYLPLPLTLLVRIFTHSEIDWSSCSVVLWERFIF